MASSPADHSCAASDLADRLAGAMTRAGVVGELRDLERLSGGANLESWRFAVGEEAFVLRRAPSVEWINNRPLSMGLEATVIRQAHGAGVPAPEVVVELSEADGLGVGFIMRAISGSADPKEVLPHAAPELIDDIAGALAGIHAMDTASLGDVPVLKTADGVEGLAEEFESFGGDRPIIALGLAWLRNNLPADVPPRLVHGDFRIGNLMTDNGRLSGVLDWELCHLGDPHEDLAFGCMAVWRFGAIDKPAFGLSDLDRFFTAYTAAGGGEVDRARFRFWLIYRTVWWALGCLSMGAYWRDGSDRSLERVVVARRTAEQELDLLMLLEDEAGVEVPPVDPAGSAPSPGAGSGEPSASEILQAVSEWLSDNIKPQLSGRDRFDLAVARNALGIVQRELAAPMNVGDRELAQDILAGRQDIATPGLLTRLRRNALAKVLSDMPKYPSISIARARWETPTQ